MSVVPSSNRVEEEPGPREKSKELKVDSVPTPRAAAAGIKGDETDMASIPPSGGAQAGMQIKIASRCERAKRRNRIADETISFLVSFRRQGRRRQKQEWRDAKRVTPRLASGEKTLARSEHWQAARAQSLRAPPLHHRSSWAQVRATGRQSV